MTLIGSLLFCSRPTTVFGRIGTVVVDAVERVTLRRLTAHVSKKIFVDGPPFANSNASTAIAVIAVAFWIVASVAHANPSDPFRCQFATYGVTMTNRFSFSAATGNCFATLEMASCNCMISPAITTAKPSCSARACSISLNGNQTTKTLTNKIAERRHE